jgi:hypothetical protein
MDAPGIKGVALRAFCHAAERVLDWSCAHSQEITMAAKRMTKDDVPTSFGAFKPVGHVVVALENDACANEAAQALRDAGFAQQDILQYSAAEEADALRQLFPKTTGTAEFGHEIVLMREYSELAEQGCGWLIVYAPDDARTQKVANVARRFDARIAVKYHLLAVEELTLNASAA